ncbi:MAG: cell division protein FtsZ [Bacteroidia bacterium]|jgi:cell division protein FtsZ
MAKDIMNFNLPKEETSIIKVIGVGGGGSNAVNHMFEQGIRGVDFVVCNTDQQALDRSAVPRKIVLGAGLTEGRGAGAQAEVGRNAAIESMDEINSVLENNTKMVFITAGMGGGTGTGAAPVIAEAARELGILTVAIVTIPFGFEGKKRRMQAESGLQELKKYVDTVLVVSNDKLREMYGNLKLSDAFSQADSVLTVGAKGIAEIITVSGYVNVDFEDVRTVMSNSGVAIMGSAVASGSDRAMKAVHNALASPLLNDNNIHGASNILLYINSGNEEVSMDEVTEITDYIQEEAGMDADVIWGNGVDESLGDQLSITVVATGFDSNKATGVPSESQPQKKVFDLHAPTTTPIAETPSVPTPETRRPLLINPDLENLAQEIKTNPIVGETPEVSERTVHNLLDEVEETPAAELATEPEVEATFEGTIEPIINETEEIETPAELPTENSFLEEESLIDQQISEPTPLPEEITGVTTEEVEVLNQTAELEHPEPEIMADAETTPEPIFTPEIEKPTMINFDLPKKIEEPEVKKMDLFEDTPTNEVDASPEEPQLIRKSAEEVAANNPVSMDELQRLQSERFERLRETASKFRTPASLTDLENVPAYKRRNVKLNNVPHSSDNPVSKFTLTDNGNGEEGGNGGTDLRSNNSFLHDNVD